jgi:hypothetical protein
LLQPLESCRDGLSSGELELDSGCPLSHKPSLQFRAEPQEDTPGCGREFVPVLFQVIEYMLRLSKQLLPGLDRSGSLDQLLNEV